MKHTFFRAVLMAALASALILPTAFAEDAFEPAQSASYPTKSSQAEEISDTTTADNWFTTQKETEKMTTETKEETKQRKDKESSRYAYLLSDSGYDYYLDLRATRWVQIPHGDEQILDTWVKLMPEKTEDEAAQDGTYTYPQKYYLAHYYIRPKTQQIQFLSELEVSGGRPDNTVQGRGYSAQNWESLTPDSIEDEIYHGALDRVKKQKAKKNPLTALTGDNGPKNLRDALEEYFRISL